MDNVAEIAGKLCASERERLTGWAGPAGAAYNAVTEFLTEMGLLYHNTGLPTETGKAVRAYLQEQQ